MSDQGYGSQEALRRRQVPRNIVADHASSIDVQYLQPGQPVGFLRARGTVYEKKYLSRKLGCCCLCVGPITLVIFLALTFFPILYALANHTLHTAVLHVHQSNITSPGNTSFPITLEGQVTKAGIFPARLYFREPVEVWWVLPPRPGQNASKEALVEVHLGQMIFDSIGAAAGHARIKQATMFKIHNVAAFGEFAQFLITKPEFTWKINCSSVHAEAFGFLPTYKNLVFNKHVVVKGFNNFEDVRVLDFQIPGSDPQGGASLSATVSLRNPSPFGFQLGTLNVALFYNGMYLGPASATNLNITAGLNVATLSGRILPQFENATALELLGQIFTGYINGRTVPTLARGVSATQNNGESVGWLSQGISALELGVPLKSPVPINPIKGINIRTLSLIYTPQTAYSPTAFSNAISAELALPFGIPLSIVEAANTFTILYQGVQVGTINSAYSNSTTQLTVISSGQTAGTVNLTLPPSQLTLANDTQAARTELELFQSYLTLSNGTAVRLQGASKAITDTPMGRVILDGIVFDVDSGLLGLQGLAAYPSVINHVDATGGTVQGIQLTVAATLINPSNLNLSLGDTSFQLVHHDIIGTVTLSNLNLLPGRNDVNATALFDANASPYGLEALNRFISGLDTDIEINGFSGSTEIVSLSPALSRIRLNTTLPGLNATLIKTANLTVLETTGVIDNVANATVFLANPFTTSLTITHIRSNVTSHGIFVASIDTPLSFAATGNAVTQSPPIPLGLNLYPPDLFGLVRALAVQSGQDPIYIDALVQLGGYTMAPTTAANMRRSLLPADMVEEGAESYSLAALTNEECCKGSASLRKRANLFTGFDLPSYVDRAFRSATANLEIVAESTIGDYATTFTLAQQDVPLGTDVTLNRLLPVLARPIVQKIVDGAILNIDRVTILDPEQESFQTALQGTITETGPFDATLQFAQGLNVTWNGRMLGQLALPNVSFSADVGATLEVMAQFVVADVNYLSEFTRYLVTERSFVWNVAGDNLRVAALGIEVDGISFSKNVILSAFDGLKNSVIINSFDLPSNDPAGGIHLTADATIYNPSQVGVQLSRFGINLSRNGTLLGPGSADEPFVLQALAVTTLPLAGRLVPQTTQQGLAVLSEVFQRFVNDINTDVTVSGDFAGPPTLTWLNQGIKALVVKVSLPSQSFTVIRTISINQISLYFSRPTAWSPPATSNNTQAEFFLPFAFPVDIQQGGGRFIAQYQDRDMAELDIPLSPSITDVTLRIVTLMFTNIPFDVYGSGHAAFSQFLADVTAGTQVTFNVHGSVGTKINTAAGIISLNEIPFNVDTNLLGLQNLNARPASISNLDVFHGFPSYLQINADASLFNPSHVTIGAGDVSLNVVFMGRTIGTAVIQGLVLVPGTNIVPTQVRYAPQGAANVAAGQQLLENYVQGIVSTISIEGSRDTTPIDSLRQALSGIRLQADIPPLHQLLLARARLAIPPNIAQTGIAQANFDLSNPFTASISLLKVKADALYQGIALGRIDQDLTRDPITAPGHTTVTSRFLPLQFDLDPKTLIRFVQAAAASTGTDLGPLPPLFDQVLGQASTQTSISPYPDFAPPSCHSGQQFDVLGAVLRTLRGLQTTLNVQSSDKLDDYAVNLNIVQQPVPTETDRSALYLLGPAGAPIVQDIVDQAVLSVTTANITGITNTGFDVSLQGSLTGTGPFDALIEFTEPLTVTWQGRNIAQLALPSICAFANVGVPNLSTQGHLTILNMGAFTDFAIYILHNPSFQWTVSSGKLTLRALDIIFSNVAFAKTIDFKSFNGLPGVAASNFDVYGETGNSLLIRTSASIPSPATLGIQLDTANFEIFFMGTDIGPVYGSNVFLPALGSINITLEGAITSKSGRDLQNTGILFSNFLQGKTQIIQVRGVSVVTHANGDQPVTWLSAAFKTLSLDVALPGHVYKVIFSITISDFTLYVQGDPSGSYMVPTSSNSTIAMFANPFSFSLQPIQATSHINISYANGNTAYIDLPQTNVQAGTSHGPNDLQAIQLMWRRQDLVAVDRASFQQFFAQLTDTPRGTFVMSGANDVVAKTVIGNIAIAGLPFSVVTSLAGINSFNGVATLSDAVVGSGSPEFVWVPITVSLTNPSNITIFTNEAFLPALFQGVPVGRAELPALSLAPGGNKAQAFFYYSPANANDSTAQSLFTLYIQPSISDGISPQSAPLTIDGSQAPLTNLTPYDSLRPAIAGVRATTVLQGIGSRIVTHLNVYLTIETILTGLSNLLLGGATLPVVEIDLNARNDLATNLFIVGLQTSAKIAGTRPVDANDPDARVSFTFPDAFAVPAKGSSNSIRVPNVVLPKGLLASLPVIGQNLDLYNNLPVRIGPTAADSYLAPGLNYVELNVDTSYSLDLAGLIVPIGGPIHSIEQLLNTILQAGANLGSLLDGIPGLLTQALQGNLIGGLDQEAKQLVCTLTQLTNGLTGNVLQGILNDADCPNRTSSSSAPMPSTSTTGSTASSTSSTGASSSTSTYNAASTTNPTSTESTSAQGERTAPASLALPTSSTPSPSVSVIPLVRSSTTLS